MAQDRLLLSDGTSNLLLSDGSSVLLLSTSTGSTPDVDPNPYRRFYNLSAAGTYELDATASYVLDATRTYRSR